MHSTHIYVNKLIFLQLIVDQHYFFNISTVQIMQKRNTAYLRAYLNGLLDVVFLST